MRDPLGCKPVTKAQQISGHGSERANLLEHLPVDHAPKAHGHSATVYVKSCHAPKYRFHHAPVLLLGLRWRSPEEETVCSACSTPWNRQQSWVRRGDQVKLLRELKASQTLRPWSIVSVASITFSCTWVPRRGVKNCFENRSRGFAPARRSATASTRIMKLTSSRVGGGRRPRLAVEDRQL